MLVGLVDDLAVRVAERADGRDVDDPGRAGGERRAQGPLGAEHVRLVHAAVLGLRDPDLVDGRAVDHRVAALEARLERGPVGEVADHQLAAEGLEPATALGVADQGPDLVAALAQGARHASADESGPAGEEYSHPMRRVSVIAALALVAGLSGAAGGRARERRPGGGAGELRVRDRRRQSRRRAGAGARPPRGVRPRGRRR